MDLLDLIDENDNVIGVTDKQSAHTNRLPHRVAAVFVFNQNGELYVQVHKKSGKFDHSVGGHVKMGEAYANAAKREAAEELGINQPLKKVASLYSSEGSFLHMFELYECVANEKWLFTPNNEVEQIIPMKLSDIQSQIAKNPEKFSSDFKLAIGEYTKSN